MRRKTLVFKGRVRYNIVRYSESFEEKVMYKIVKKRELNPTVTLMEVAAPFVARKAEPGQ